MQSTVLQQLEQTPGVCIVLTDEFSRPLPAEGLYNNLLQSHARQFFTLKGIILLPGIRLTLSAERCTLSAIRCPLPAIRDTLSAVRCPRYERPATLKLLTCRLTSGVPKIDKKSAGKKSKVSLDVASLHY